MPGWQRFSPTRNVGHGHRGHPFRGVHRRLAPVQRLRAGLRRRRPHPSARRSAHIPRRLGCGLVSRDRHATIVPVALDEASDDETEALVDKVEALDGGAFAVSVTGEETLDHDFNALSQEDLENGELKFGLPAALIILLLVFGAVVAGLMPLLMAIVAIVVALGLAAMLAQEFELSVFLVNMLTGMGLALGIDYSLFVVSRYREERGRGGPSSPRSRRRGRRRAGRCSSAAASS